MSVNETSNLLENHQPAQPASSNPSQYYSKLNISNQQIEALNQHESDQSKQDEENKILTTLDEFHSQPEETVGKVSNFFQPERIEEDNRELEEIQIDYTDEREDFVNDFQYLDRKKEPILSDNFPKYQSIGNSNDLTKPFLPKQDSNESTGAFSSSNLKPQTSHSIHDHHVYKPLKNVNPEEIEIELETMPQGFPYHNIKTLTSLKEMYETRRNSMPSITTQKSVGNQTPQLYSMDSLISPQFEDHRLDSLLLVPQEDYNDGKQSKLSKLLFKKSNRAKLFYCLSMICAIMFWFVPCLSVLPLVMVFANFKNSHNQKHRKFSKYAKKSLYFIIMYDLVMFATLFICIVVALIVKFKK
ncbi:predicted protein [Naegleria gruberi]|uniref:Predicted protein n=1 Tax=Naegleria gruberi TaxID=5762 RepID=D2VYG1_NAEGR|nr:uncharacterized protein NAEGRDRAFT_74108 [Naegleria gruberi]EFC38105.1 predicted protein [Naegleria gruberi]|eukprot:XP_002670849.1 predicted protein [Naegleria gruberi strain NEG-M]